MRDRIASGRAKIIEAPLPGGGLSIGHDRKEVAESLDYSPTPPWGTRCLPEIVLPQISVRQLGTVWEPACGEGHMAEVLREFSGDVTASDIHEYGYNDHLIDFLSCEHFNRQRDPDWIITNPPFNKAEEFALHALKLARVGVALFVRWQWIEGVNRFNDLFGPYPPAIVAVFSERIPLHMGRWEPAGATMTAYCWVVWLKNHTGDTRLFWIPPGQRKALTKDDDAERFTAHPVIRKQHVLCDEPFDTTTGEILDPPAAGDLNPASTPEPVPDTVSSAVPESGAGSLSCEDDGLDIPPFLRRPPPPVQSETSHDKAR
jgi:hypothetical protein